VWTGKNWILKGENSAFLRRIDYVYEGALYYLYICTCRSVLSNNVCTNPGCSNFELFLLPLALQPTVGFGLSNNTSPFFPIYHQLSPSSHSHHLKISLLLLYILSWVFLFFSSFPVPECWSFWASYSPPFSPGDPANLPFAPLSILLYFLLLRCSASLSQPRPILCKTINSTRYYCH